jgi:hypothetical protein
MLVLCQTVVQRPENRGILYIDLIISLEANPHLFLYMLCSDWLPTGRVDFDSQKERNNFLGQYIHTGYRVLSAFSAQGRLFDRRKARNNKVYFAGCLSSSNCKDFQSRPTVFDAVGLNNIVDHNSIEH